MQLGIRYYKY